MIEFPSMRRELISTLNELSDAQFQQSHWIGSDSPTSCFDFAVHFLFDDTTLSEEPLEWVGKIFRFPKEATAVSAVISAIEDIFDEFGTNLSDMEYISKPSWQKVVAASILARKVLEAPS